MEKTIDFKVNEQSLQEFADEWFIASLKDAERHGEIIDRRQNEVVNPYYIIGKDEIYVKKKFIEFCGNNLIVVFTLSDETQRNRTKLMNTYQYSIEKYDDVSLVLRLVDFKIDII